MVDAANIVLIGMPGVGKSTVGVLLAKATGRAFIDTDDYIQTREGRRLQDVIDADGLEAFCRMEERHILDLNCRSHVIATGGSVIYSDPAMTHLKAGGRIVRLHLSIERLTAHLDNLDVRGVVMAAGETLTDLYRRREPLYARWADATIECEARTQDQVVAAILAELGRPVADDD